MTATRLAVVVNAAVRGLAGFLPLEEFGHSMVEPESSDVGCTMIGAVGGDGLSWRVRLEIQPWPCTGCVSSEKEDSATTRLDAVAGRGAGFSVVASD